jgi:hypothetical protein
MAASRVNVVQREDRARGLKWPKLDELVSEPEEYFGEARVSGRDVPAIWRGVPGDEG